jgi:hypothetical protein
MNVLYLLPLLLLVGVLGLWLAKRRNRALAATGSSMAAFVAGVLVFIVVAVPVYGLFYSLNPFDSYANEGVTAFKIGFWISYAAHLLLTAGIVVLLAWRLRRPILTAAVGAVLASALLAYPTIAMLAWFNNCYGMEYPLGRISCG